MKGKFITFEGCEGSGKTTQVDLAGEYLRSRGLDVVTTREPGGTGLSEAIRGVILDRQWKNMSPRCELLLYLAARAQHHREKIDPVLTRGGIVLCDRYMDATAAYQGYGRGLSLDDIKSLNNWAAGGVEPDMTFMFFLDTETGLERETDRDRFHDEKKSFHDSVQRGYRDIALRYPERIVPIDIDGLTIEEVFGLVKTELGRII